MNILIYGIGAMGSIYASLLSKTGNKVFVVDNWEEHIKEIKRNGLKVEGASGTNINKTLEALSEVPDDINFELIIISTKASGVRDAAIEIKKIVKDNTIIVSIQNGIGSSDEIKNYIPKKNVLVGVADGFGASIIKPGHVHHNAMKLIRFGELEGGITERLKSIKDLWVNAGFNAVAFENINQLIWEKFICNVTFSAPCTVYNCTVGELINNDSYWKVANGCTLEAYEISKLKNIKLSFDNPLQYVRDFGEKMPNAKPSMLLDHLSKRKSEIDFINGRVELMGKEVGVKTPYNFILSSIVKNNEQKF
jgi:2-dehydropantoate 2-reductase